jgi:hypothetical protein
MPKISQLPAGGPATGGELIPAVQNGETVRLFPSQLIGAGATQASQTPFATGPGEIIWALDELNILAFGGVGDGVTDNTAALFTAASILNSMINSGGGTIYFPPGKYLFNASPLINMVPTAYNTLSLVGAGLDATQLIFPNSNGLVINFSSTGASCNIRDLSIVTGSPGVWTGLQMIFTAQNGAPGFNPQSVIERVAFRSTDTPPPTVSTNFWKVCARVDNVCNVIFVSCNFLGNYLGGANVSNQGIGVRLAGNTSIPSYQVSIYFNKCSFNALAAGISFNDWLQGVFVTDCNFTLCQWGILVNPSLAGVLNMLSVINSQFNCHEAFHVGSAIADINICNNLFLIAAGFTGIYMANSSFICILGNNFQGVGDGATGLNLIAGSQINISGNNFCNFSPTGTGIIVGAGAAQVLVADNIFANNGTSLTNAGPSTQIFDNSGLDPFGVFPPATVGASPATVTAGASRETHYVKQSATNTATISLGGQVIHTLKDPSTSYVVQLEPGEGYVVNWTTTAPTYIKDAH